MTEALDPFVELLAEITDGQKWRVIRAEGWEEFCARLAESISTLSPRRRQAIIMLLVALATEAVQPEQVEDFLRGRDMDTDDELEALVAWLRQRRPKLEGE
jgi:hypothetical protein